MIVALALSVVKHSGRSLRSGGLPLFFAVLMCALGLFSLTAFGTLLWNFRSIAVTVGESVAAVAFLDVDSAAGAEEARAQLQLLPGVSRASLMTPDEALARARRGLEGAAALDVAGLTMPWVVELTPRFDLDNATARTTLVAAAKAVPGVDEVVHPGGELERVDALLRLLHGAGLFLAVLISLVVVVVVSNAVRLTVLVRRDEIAIQKLVGASDTFVALPLLLSGVVQGTVGAVLGLLALAVAHSSLAQVVKVALSGVLGTFVLEPLPPSLLALVVVAGALLGAVGAGFSVTRYLRER
jgi:cell division transport system permease protein